MSPLLKLVKTIERSATNGMTDEMIAEVHGVQLSFVRQIVGMMDYLAALGEYDA